MNNAHSARPPAPAMPITSYLAAASRPGVSADGRYLVLPRVVLDQLPVPVQQELVELVAAIHTMAAGFPWPPAYRVGAVRWAPVNTLTEAELREVGLIAELDAAGDLVYRDVTTTGRALPDDELQRPVPVSTSDPLYAHLDQNPPTARR